LGKNKKMEDEGAVWDALARVIDGACRRCGEGEKLAESATRMLVEKYGSTESIPKHCLVATSVMRASLRVAEMVYKHLSEGSSQIYYERRDLEIRLEQLKEREQEMYYARLKAQSAREHVQKRVREEDGE